MTPDRHDTAVHARRFRGEPRNVVVAGGGVAALETCLALRALAGEGVQLTLVAPDRPFSYRPAGMADPLDPRGHPIDSDQPGGGLDGRCAVLRPARGGRRRGPSRRHGRRRRAALRRARRGRWGGSRSRAGQRAARRHSSGDEPPSARAGRRGGGRRRLPWRWSLRPRRPGGSSCYELALDLALAVRREGVATTVTVVTAEETPMAILGQLRSRSCCATH